MGSEIRIGKVSSIDYAAGMVRVVYHDKDDSVTRPLPLLSDEYRMPEVGDQVLVVHLSNGTEAGIVLGRPWSRQNVPTDGMPGLYRKELGREPGEAYLVYQDGSLVLKARNVVVQGDLYVSGNLFVAGQIATSEGTLHPGD